MKLVAEVREAFPKKAQLCLRLLDLAGRYAVESAAQPTGEPQEVIDPGDADARYTIVEHLPEPHDGQGVLKYLRQ